MGRRIGGAASPGVGRIADHEASASGPATIPLTDGVDYLGFQTSSELDDAVKFALSDVAKVDGIRNRAIEVATRWHLLATGACGPLREPGTGACREAVVEDRRDGNLGVVTLSIGLRAGLETGQKDRVHRPGKGTVRGRETMQVLSSRHMTASGRRFHARKSRPDQTIAVPPGSGDCCASPRSRRIRTVLEKPRLYRMSTEPWHQPRTTPPQTHAGSQRAATADVSSRER